mmetsp:Transcript_7642/g.18694  ORF Transcript_7642/g.18694 Transcript_7642/m.18694 type:complete len:284 (+) Transcript_7642:1483-2334(+)
MVRGVPQEPVGVVLDDHHVIRPGHGIKLEYPLLACDLALGVRTDRNDIERLWLASAGSYVALAGLSECLRDDAHVVALDVDDLVDVGPEGQHRRRVGMLVRKDTISWVEDDAGDLVEGVAVARRQDGVQHRAVFLFVVAVGGGGGGGGVCAVDEGWSGEGQHRLVELHHKLLRPLSQRLAAAVLLGIVEHLGVVNRDFHLLCTAAVANSPDSQLDGLDGEGLGGRQTARKQYRLLALVRWHLEDGSVKADELVLDAARYPFCECIFPSERLGVGDMGGQQRRR